MFDTSTYAERRQSVLRHYRLSREHRALIDATGISAEAKALHAYLIDKPTTWEISVTQIVKTRHFGGKDRVHRLIREMRCAGYMLLDQQRTDDGRFKRGIYLISDEPRWAKEGKAFQGINPEPENAVLGIVKSIDITKKHNMRAERSTDACVRGETSKSERPQAVAKCCSPAETAQAPSKGSAVASEGAEASAQSNAVLNDEHLITELTKAGGKALADRKVSNGLWRLGVVWLWVQMGYDLQLDILPAIRWRARHSRPGSIYSWSYFSGIIAEQHAARLRGLPSPFVSAAKLRYFEEKQAERARDEAGREDARAYIARRLAEEEAAGL